MRNNLVGTIWLFEEGYILIAQNQVNSLGGIHEMRWVGGTHDRSGNTLC